MKRTFPIFLCIIFSFLSKSQSDTRTLFTVGSEKVLAGEFQYVYNKNNVNNIADYSEKSLRDYLNLYENFRLKVKEAESLKLDTISSLKTELEGYRKQLAKAYLTDREISDKLILEAYERSKTEINASHILVKCDENANPADTLAAFKKITALKKRLDDGESFEKVAKENSEDPSAKTNEGNIGWFTVFGTVYAFESAVYSLKQGAVSNAPIRTEFGYHLVKVNQIRKARGQFHVAHVLIRFPQDASLEQKDAVKKKVDEAYYLIVSGKRSFEDVVKEYSDDKGSRDKGGELQWFGSGTSIRMVPEFEDASFSLMKDGEISQPVMTQFGWHIIKRLGKREILSFTDAKADIKKKVERDSRSQMAKAVLVKRIKTENGFKEFDEAKSNFISQIQDNVLAGDWKADNIPYSNKVLFQLAGKNFTYYDFASYIEKNSKKRSDKTKDALLYEYYNAFVNSKCLEYEESILETKKPEFRNLMKEYRDGILLFELMDRQVWTKAVKDKEGRYSFYLKNSSRYKNGFSDKDSVIISDYQEHIEKNWLAELRNKYPVVLDETVLKSMINNPTKSDFFPEEASDKSSSQSIKTPPAVLEVKNIKFKDANSNNRIDAFEICTISFDITNTGKGPANSVVALINSNSSMTGLRIGSTSLGDIASSTTKSFSLSLSGSAELTSGIANIQVSFTEARGFTPDPFDLKIETKEFLKPQVKVVDYSFLSDIGKIKLGIPVQLKCMIQNVGQGNAEDVSVEFFLPENVFPNSEQSFSLGDMEAGKAKEVVFEFLPNKLYKQSNIPINAVVKEKYGKYSQSETCTAQIDEATKGTTITIASNAKDVQQEIQVASLSSDIDKNIPVNTVSNAHRYALIIGNEDYTKYQTSLSSESNVAFAASDAGTFAAYCEKTLGVPHENVTVIQNAIGSKMKQEIDKITKLIQYENGNAEVIFYYAGHGFPDEATKESYIMPVDISGSNVTDGIKLSDLYQKLTANPVKRVTVFLDACFSGGGRDAGLLAARSVKIKPKANSVTGNLLVMSASSGEQSSLPYKDKQHGMFTYYLLKKLQETKGDVLYKDLYDYVKQQVELNSIKVNGKDQNPQLNYSSAIEDSWGAWKVK